MRTIAILLLAACEVGEPPRPPVAARELFTTSAWPALARCAGCHAAQPTIDFLAPGTAEGAYTAVFEYQPPILEVESPGSSLLLGMGQHTGPELLPDESTALLGWLEAERDERTEPPVEPIVVGPVALQLGVVNTVPLPVDGAVLRFTPTAVAAGLSLTDLEIQAGPGGLHAVHPLFSSRPVTGLPIIDTADRYRDVELELAGSAVDRLGGGATLFTRFPSTDQITIHFRTLEAP